MRRSKVVGNPKAGIQGWLSGWDPEVEDAMMPHRVDAAANQLAEWIKGQSAWFAGDWAAYPILCRWQVYQEVGLIIKALQRRKEYRDWLSNHVLTSYRP
jgi:hypothetical protein